jgi:cytochrome c biogenesis protein CcdA
MFSDKEGIMRRKSYLFWQFVLGAVSSFSLVTAGALLRGQAFGDNWLESLLWSGVAASVFAAARYAQARKGGNCALCDSFRTHT